LIALEVEGYVDVRPGSGILVTTQKRAAPDDSGDEGRWKFCGLNGH